MARILFVDDDKPFLDVQVEFLTSIGHAVFTASSGMNTLEMIENHQIDLLITDIIMPDQDGLQTIREAHKKYPELKIIAMSGGGRLVSRDNLVIASKIGANEVLDKPFTFENLKLAIEKVL